jgi:hypothetical protein
MTAESEGRGSGRAAGAWAHRARVIEAAALLCGAWVAVRLVPFRGLAPLLGTPRPPGAAAVAPCPPGAATAALAVRWALLSAARRLPWTSTCLMRTLAGRLMLARRGVPCVARFGVSGSRLDRAHAWLIAGGLDVSGGDQADGYRPVGDFTS